MFKKYCLSCCKKIIPDKKNKHAPKNPKFCPECAKLKKLEHCPDKQERYQKKAELVKMLGGKCSECGYDKSIRALSFHHLDPATKQFDISNGHLLKEWDIVVEEAKKCKLLCLNCHACLHNFIEDSHKPK